MRVIGVFNRGGGTFKTTDMDALPPGLSGIFTEHGHELDARIVGGDQLIDALKSACTRTCRNHPHISESPARVDRAGLQTVH